jgi:hypothetical protein
LFMKRLRSNILSRLLSFAAVFLFVIPLNSGSAPAQEPKTKIKHTPLSFFVSENRIKISADVTDEAGVKVVRCYFRAAGQADYVFVRMESVKEDRYEGILPKPRKDTQTLEYILLAVNQKDRVVKTEAFRVEKKDGKEVPEWQKVVSEGEIRVSTELAKAPETLPGFKDSISLDVVESAGRFGTAVGIYLLIDTGGGSAAATAEETIRRFQEANRVIAAEKSATGLSTSAGLSTSTGLSTKAIVAIAAGVVAGGGTLVAVVGNSGGDDKDNAKPYVQSSEISSDFNKITVRFNEKMDTSASLPSDAVSVEYIPDSSASVQWGHSEQWSNDSTLSISISRDKEKLSPGMIKLSLKGGILKDMNDNYMDENTFSFNMDEDVTVIW